MAIQNPNNGHTIEILPHRQKKKRTTVKLAYVGGVLLAMYAVFVYGVLVFFDKHGVSDIENRGMTHGANRLGGDRESSGHLVGETSKNGGEGVLEPALRSKEKNKQVGNKQSEFNMEDIEAILTGSILKNISLDDIKIARPQSVGTGNDEEGLRDRRSAHDIVSSVLSAAKYGDRRYDTDGDQNSLMGGRLNEMPILTAYCEPINQTIWKTKPLPVRLGSETKKSLISISYPHVTSCQALPSQWPIDTPPVDLDPFLPWIHDVFPSSDGNNVVFVAQNRRRCFNGQRYTRASEQLPEGVVAQKGYVHIDPAKNYFMRPQAALFQHVPVKKITIPEKEEGEPRFRLASHEDADEDGMETRFICRFKTFDQTATPKLSIVGYSLSRFDIDYDYHTYRKGYLRSHSDAGYDNHVIWTSQLLFKCPIPDGYRDKVQSGETVQDDYATLYVDLVPIRTPPRYTPPREFFPPRYNFTSDIENLFMADIEWGKDHTLPKIDESGRWENIPICMPSLMTHGIVPKGIDLRQMALPTIKQIDKRKTVEIQMEETGTKIHKIIACTWASTTFKTRSNRARVGDGKRRLKEWLEFNILAGFDHVYVYDNSGAFTNEDSLEDIINLFPRNKVTRIDWPCKICSNRDGNEGERSSQYAAESSCRLRFGSHAKWLGSFDTDEYLIPMGKFDSIGDVSEYLDRKGMYIAEFKSSPAKPRFDLLDNPKNTEEGDGQFTPTVKDEETFLHTYNCNWEQFPRSNTMTHRSKQMYRSDYVKLHYVHYATATVVSQMTEAETRRSGFRWKHKYKEGYLHHFYEVNEATMLHTKSKVAHNTKDWKRSCKQPSHGEFGCMLGFPLPIGVDSNTQQSLRSDGWAYNCFINEKIESYWWPKLVDAIADRDRAITQ